MEMIKSNAGDKLVLELKGRLDTNTAPELQAALLPELDNTPELELNFAGLNYISSAGLRVLLMGQKAALKGGKKLTVTHVSPDIMEVFEMTGFVDVLTIQ